jgi:hypothetical protein
LGDIINISAAPYPLFARLKEEFAPKSAKAFESVDVLSCQHLLGSIVPEFEAIRRMLPSARFWEIIGKPYSANPAAIRVLDEYGFKVNFESSVLPERGDGASSYRLGSFAHRHREVVGASVRRFFNLMPPEIKMSSVPILVIDDGGALVNAVGRAAQMSGTTRPIVCVEQTQRGLHAAHPLTDSRDAPSGGFAVVNVAQTLSKLVLESKLIARSVIGNLESWMSQFGVTDDVGVLDGNWRLGIVGFGSVGESIAAELRTSNVNAIIYDSNRNRAAGAKRQGYDVALSVEEMLDHADVIIGATGGSWLNQSCAEHLRDGAILASASSGDGEFQGLSTWKSDQMAILDSVLQVPMFDNIHGEIRCQKPDGGSVHVLNGGFPVNFNGSIDPIDPSEIQLTRTLMLAGVLQAMEFEGDESDGLVGRTGIFNLSETLDRFLFESYTNIEESEATATSKGGN